MTKEHANDKPTSAARDSKDGECGGYSSPACLAHEMDPTYAGYLSDSELIELLNTLLEGERAGDKVAESFIPKLQSQEAKALLETIKRDEARFAAMLARLVKKLGGTPSNRIGAFYDKAMAIEGLTARLAFLNRGQSWVVRKLEETLPRVRDDRVHAALKGMLGAHEINIARCEALIQTAS